MNKMLSLMAACAAPPDSHAGQCLCSISCYTIPLLNHTGVNKMLSLWRQDQTLQVAMGVSIYAPYFVTLPLLNHTGVNKMLLLWRQAHTLQVAVGVSIYATYFFTLPLLAPTSVNKMLWRQVQPFPVSCGGQHMLHTLLLYGC